MTIIQAIILGLIQGLTEFIPVSSSGHLLLAHNLMGIQDNGLIFDVALHLGTLTALTVVFCKDIYSLVMSIFKKSKQTKLAWLLILATLPAVVARVLLQSLAETKFRSVILASIAMIIMAFIMITSEKYSSKLSKRTKIDDVNINQALAMGFAQAVALIPGVSRSGVTITTGLFAGIDRVAATRFTFLLAIPITLGAILKIFVSNGTINQISSQPDIFIIGIITAFVSGIFAIKFMLSYLAKHTLNIFAYYRIIVATVSLIAIALW